MFWDSIDRFVSPVPASVFSRPLPAAVQFTEIELPARRAYEDLRDTKPDPQRVLVVCGYWGQGPVISVTRQLLETIPEAKIDLVCGENADLYAQASRVFQDDSRIALHGCLPSMLALMSICSAVVTKPGISTLLEAHAAKRKIFLLPGMPVAEDNNARYAIRNFGADWFSVGALRKWNTDRAEF